jgi:hypothetical protein
VTYEGGFAQSQGIIQTPIGPFQMEPGSRLDYGRVDYENGRLHLAVFGNFFDGQAPSLLTRAGDGSVLRINFKAEPTTFQAATHSWSPAAIYSITG